jgi:hypothetical protein
MKTTNATKESTMKVACYTNNGTLVISNIEVQNMTEARYLAAQWNKDNETGLKVSVIQSNTGLVTTVAC